MSWWLPNLFLKNNNSANPQVHTGCGLQHWKRNGILFLIFIQIVYAVLSAHLSILPDTKSLPVTYRVQEATRVTPGKMYRFYDAGSAYHDVNYTCPVPWEWTRDLSEADAVWFNVLQHTRAGQSGVEYLKMGELPLKVFMSLESEVYYPDILTAKANGYFDYMVDYRIWSNLSDFVPAVYLMNPTNNETRIDFRRPPRLPKRSDALIAAFVSNCNARNNRGQYMEELMTHMPVHSYGHCCHNKDEPASLASASKSQKKISIGGEYYFWFTAENSNAESYVTEKVYEALDAGVVPVYFGAPNVDRFVPHPSAVIMADRYSPRELAILLNETASDPAKYASYFEWKKKPFTEDFNRILRLASRTVQCRLAMHLEGLDMERESVI